MRLNKKGLGLPEVLIDALSYLFVILLFLGAFALLSTNELGKGKVSENEIGSSNLEHGDLVLNYLQAPVKECTNQYANKELLASFKEDFTYLELTNLMMKVKPKEVLYYDAIEPYCRDGGHYSSFLLGKYYIDKIENNEYTKYLETWYYCTTDYLQDRKQYSLSTAKACQYPFHFNIIIKSGETDLINLYPPAKLKPEIKIKLESEDYEDLHMLI